MDIANAAAAALGAFGLLKGLFLFVGWYTRDHEDHTLRRRLDELVSALDNYSQLELASGFFRRLTQRIRETWAHRKRPVIIFIAFSAVSNLASVILLVEGYARLENDVSGFELLRDAATESSMTTVLLLGVMIVGLPTLFDLASLWFTWKLISAAARYTSLLRIGSHVVLDLVIAVTAVFWSLAVFVVAEHLVASASEGRFLAAHVPLIQYPSIILQRIVERPGYLLSVSVLGITSAFPTLMYIMLASFLLLVLVSPGWLRNSASRIVFLVTTDDRPLFSQLGTLAGITGSVIALTVGLLATNSVPEVPAHKLGSPESVRFPAIEAKIDSALANDSRNWALRSYKKGSVRLYSISKEKAAQNEGQNIKITGNFTYVEWGREYLISFTATLNESNKKHSILSLCWQTLGGKDCVE